MNSIGSFYLSHFNIFYKGRPGDMFAFETMKKRVDQVGRNKKNWVKVAQTSTCEHYWYHKLTGIVTWEDPAGPDPFGDFESVTTTGFSSRAGSMASADGGSVDGRR